MIGYLQTTHGKVKQSSHETKENITSLTVQDVEEIVETYETIIKEVLATKDASKKFIHAWRKVQ